MNKKPLSLLFLFGALIALVLINQIFIRTGLYFQITWLDQLMHFLGGLFVGLIGIYFLSLLFNTRQKISAFFILIASLLSAFIIGCLWEIVELNSETIFQIKLTEKITSEDSLNDIYFDGIGAFVAAVYFILLKSRAGLKTSPLLDKK